MHTQNNGYNMKMSSKYDQSGTEPSFLPPQGLLSRSSRPRGERGCVSLPKPHAVSRGSLTIPPQSHFQKTFLLIYFLKMGVCKTCDFSNSTLSYVGNLFTSRRPRCSKVLFWKVRGKVESSFFILYTQAPIKGQEIFAKGGGHFPAAKRGPFFCHFSSEIKVYITKTNRPRRPAHRSTRLGWGSAHLRSLRPLSVVVRTRWGLSSNWAGGVTHRRPPRRPGLRVGERCPRRPASRPARPQRPPSAHSSGRHSSRPATPVAPGSAASGAGLVQGLSWRLGGGSA